LAMAARTRSESGIYHVIVSGINRHNIFQDEEDKSVYLDRLTNRPLDTGKERMAAEGVTCKSQ
jgi:hypothetical protein